MRQSCTHLEMTPAGYTRPTCDQEFGLLRQTPPRVNWWEPRKCPCWGCSGVAVPGSQSHKSEMICVWHLVP